MGQSDKPSIEQAAREAGLSVSALTARTVRHRLRIDAGRRGLAEWEAENGALTAEERAEGLAQANSLLHPAPTDFI